MAETLDAFRRRTEFVLCSLPERDGFATAQGLTKKVDANGFLRPFYGNTVIFDLDAQDIAWLRAAQDVLYDACGDLLAERLDEEMFHLTLHDLVSGESFEAIEQTVDENERQAQTIVQQLRAAYPWGITVRARCAMNMVNTSVVIAFEPVDEENCRALMEMFDALQAAVPLSYPLTPHVTLAYFRPGEIDEADVARLADAFERMRPGGRVVHLAADALRYAVFTDMNRFHTPKEADDFDLDRFVRAQRGMYAQALREIRGGRKRSHWMWYVFPQLTGLGRSVMAQQYGIDDMEEAKAYLAHPILGPRLVQISDALLALEENNPTRVMGYVDEMKLQSSMTLFEAAGGGRVFSQVIDKFFGGERDPDTLEMLGGESGTANDE